MMGDLCVITATDTTLLGAVVLEAALRATVGQHRTCHTCMTATVPVQAAAVTRVSAAARQTTASQQCEQSLTQARQHRLRIRNDPQTSHVL
jgi:hypothetical protein